MTIEELQKQKDLTMETTENLKNVVDWNNIEAGEQALKAKDILLEEKDKEIAKVKNMYYRLHGEFYWY